MTFRYRKGHTMKILDGPLEGEDYTLDRRLAKLYDKVQIEDDAKQKHTYIITLNGLSYEATKQKDK